MGKKRSLQINQENKVTKYFQSKQDTKLIRIIGFHLIFSLTEFLIIIHNDFELGMTTFDYLDTQNTFKIKSDKGTKIVKLTG